MSKASRPTTADAVQAYQAGKLHSCEEICRQLLSLNPQNADASHILGMVYYANKQFYRSVKQIKHALSLAPDIPLYHANLATVLNDSGELDLAKQHYQHALQLQPNNAPAYNGLGVIARKQLDYNVAIEHYRQAIEFDDSFATAHSNLSNVLTLSGQFQLGLEHAKRALALDDKSAETWNNLGYCKTMLGDAGEAELAFERALALNPTLAIAQFNLGANQLRCGDYAKGWKNYDWRLRLNGQNPDLDPRRLKYPSLQELQGKSLNLVAEQGMGDYLQFLRFCKPLHDAGAKITTSCDQRLIPVS